MLGRAKAHRRPHAFAEGVSSSYPYLTSLRVDQIHHINSLDLDLQYHPANQESSILLPDTTHGRAAPRRSLPLSFIFPFNPMILSPPSLHSRFTLSPLHSLHAFAAYLYLF